VEAAAVEFSSYAGSVAKALDAVGAAELLAGREKILVKPNLTNAFPPPVTTPVECSAAVLAYVRRVAKAQVVIAEGPGEPGYDAADIFDELGYSTLARREGVELVDLNTAPARRLEDPSCEVFPEFHMPEVALDCFVVSVPVLKAHTLARVTGSMKNMMGFAPPRHYQQGGHWKKSAFHRRMHRSIAELNRYRAPDLTVMDAAVGLARSHLGGPACDPPVGKIVAGRDAREVDRLAAGLLGLDWRSVPHLADGDGTA
jgi:uncharacterized protein (DUF362 family)